MKHKAYFAMGLHFHQPVGNFDEILERAYSNCYKPFIDIFSEFPRIKMTFHFSGNLLDFFEARHPEFIDRIKALVNSGQVEIMGGGYYEPILQAIPQRDRIGQINMLSEYAEKKFCAKPKGAWIPERVWSPDIVKDLKGCGMAYSILDDIHLILAGVDQDNLRGYFMTGDGNDSIAIFPSSKALRYAIPFKRPREIIAYLKKACKSKENMLFSYGDDAEKFGEWPWTYDWVYKKGWLTNFFKELTKNNNWLETITFSEYLDSQPPLDNVSIPEASYEEMMKWSGGRWMNFLTKYPESDQMHKRMMYVSNRIAEISVKSQVPNVKEKLEMAKKELYKAQTNCPYWHGVFGGIYMSNLRNAIFEHLIIADRISDRIENGGQDNQANVREIDFYDKGAKAVILENRDFFICIDALRGGSIRELDYKPKSVNLINTLARHKEPYHKKILDRINNSLHGILKFHATGGARGAAGSPSRGNSGVMRRIGALRSAIGAEAPLDKFRGAKRRGNLVTAEPLEIYEAIKTIDPRLKDAIYYDRYMRSCLVDHFIEKDLAIEDFTNCNYIDLGGLADASYSVRIDGQNAILTHETEVKGICIQNQKAISIASDKEIKISYALKNNSGSDFNSLFGMEFNISMPFTDSDRYSYESSKGNAGALSKTGITRGTDFFAIKDASGHLGVELIFSSQPEKIWYFPVLTVSQSERAYSVNYQSLCIFPIWQVKLQSKGEMRMDVACKMIRAT